MPQPLSKLVTRFPGKLIKSQSLQHFALNTERKLLIVGWYEHRAIKLLEEVQRRSNKLVKGLQDIEYEERAQLLNLDSLSCLDGQGRHDIGL